MVLQKKPAAAEPAAAASVKQSPKKAPPTPKGGLKKAPLTPKGRKLPGTPDKKAGFVCTCAFRHFKACTCEENVQIHDCMITPALAARKGNPLELPEHQWMNAKEAENLEFDKMTGAAKSPLIRRVQQDRGPPAHLRSEELSEFDEPVLRKSLHEPSVPAAPFPSSDYRSGISASVLANLGMKSGPESVASTQAIFTKSQLTGADDEF